MAEQEAIIDKYNRVLDEQIKILRMSILTPHADDKNNKVDESKCGSKHNPDDRDCCAPNGEKMWCHDGFIPERTGKECWSWVEGVKKMDSNGMFTCRQQDDDEKDIVRKLKEDTSKCASLKTGNCCAPNGVKMWCLSGYIPERTGKECWSWIDGVKKMDKNGMFTCRPQD